MWVCLSICKFYELQMLLHSRRVYFRVSSTVLSTGEIVCCLHWGSQYRGDAQGRSVAQETLSWAAHRWGLGEELLLWRYASGVPGILGSHDTHIG